MPFRAEEKQKQKPTNNGTTYLHPPNTLSLNLNPVLCSILTENKTKTRQKNLTKRTTNNFDNIELIEVNNQNIRQTRIVF